MLYEEEATEIEYGFKINNKDGFYYIKFDDEIIEEKLYYMAGKQRAYLFQINKENNKIIKNLNKNIFINEKYNEELIDGIDKYWGKYTFLSLLSFETIEKNKDYKVASTIDADDGGKIYLYEDSSGNRVGSVNKDCMVLTSQFCFAA